MLVVRILCLFSVLFVVWYIVVGLIFQPDQTWSHPEAADHAKIVSEKTGRVLCFRDVIAALDVQAFEYASRPTRPLANLLDVISIKFRMWLWQFVAPHAAFSLTYIFALLLCPLLLYRLLRNLALPPELCCLTTLLYLVSPGFLSPLVMNFRSSKMMANFVILLCLCLASELNEEQKIRRVSLLRFLCFLLVLLGSFFWDETALLIYPAVIIFFPALFRGKRWIIYGLLPLVVIFFYLWLFPGMMLAVGYGKPNLLDYDVTGIPLQKILTELSQNVLQNAKLLFMDSFGLFNPSMDSSPIGKMVFGFNLLTLTALSVMLIKQRKIFWVDPIEKGGLLLRSGAFLLFLPLVHSYFLVLTTGLAQGIFWYGCYFSVFFVIFFAQVLDSVKRPLFSSICLLAAMLSLIYVFPYTNIAYHQCRRTAFCVPIHIWKYTRFHSKMTPPDLKYGITQYLWQANRASKLPKKVVFTNDLEELKYLAPELGLAISWKE